MKVLHLISGGDTGGAKTHVLTLLTRLRNINVEVELLCIMEGVFTKDAINLGIPVTIIPQKKRYDITVLKKICDFINKSDYNIVHCHGARANYIALFIRSYVKKPLLTTLHSDYKLDFKDNWHKQFIYTPINAFALRRFKYVLTVTKSFKNMLIERGFKEKRLFVVYNGINFNDKINIVNKSDFYKNFGIKYEPENVYVGIAARLQTVKGVQYFIEAAVKVLNKNDNIKFVIAGTGYEESKFKNYIKENNLSDKIYMLGHVTDINSFYNAIDINTLTSISESFPYALLEGARMKKATISTAVGGIVEMIKDGETGFLINAGDTQNLALKIEMLANNAELRNNLGNAFYEDAKNRFSDLKMAQTHKKIYEQIVKENL